MRYLQGWRPLLRIARRDARRARGRSILVLVMIALPVLGVVAADVLLATQEVSGSEALERRLGSADARIQFMGSGRVVQGFDPDEQSATMGRARTDGDEADLADVAEVLGRDVSGIELARSTTPVVTDKGIADVESTRLDLRDPLAEGIWRIDRGRAPGADDEVVVNSALAERGFALGDTLEVPDGDTYTVVGIGESTSYRDYPSLLGLDPGLTPEDLGDGSRTFLVDAGDVSWGEVRELNRIGATVLSRAVMLDPPPESEIPQQVRDWSAGTDDAFLAVAVLVVVMALMEVVLLAGPAFAVSARRQSRDLALMAATGGTPAQSRRVILASGFVLGGLAAALGVVLGLGLAWALVPVLQHFDGSWFGPYDVRWLHVAGIAAFGVASAVIAAVVPAWIASRQDVVAVLAGRRADRPAGLRSPLLGLLLLGAGVAGAVAGATNGSGGEILIAASAIPSVLGMILLVPVVLVALARLSGRLPLAMRYAVRDAARHRTRTVPAVAAVAATVAGVVALGVANASDAAQSEANYTPSLPMGQASLISWDERTDVWDTYRGILASEAPGATVTDVRGIPENVPDGFRSITLANPEPGGNVGLSGWTSTLGSSVLVSDGALPPLPADFEASEVAAAEEMLASGGAVVFTSVPQEADRVRVHVRDYPPRGGRGEVIGKATLPALYLTVPGEAAPGQGVMSESALKAAGVETAQVAMLVDGDVTSAQEQDIEEAVSAISQNASFYVERGWSNEDETVILLLVLGGLGGLLMLGGTLTATFLALSDARPDLATLSAVGASPRSRRGVAASYAMVVGLVGAVLGAGVGFIPGIAVTYPLTDQSWATCASVDESGNCVPLEGVSDHFLAVPWLLVGVIVLALPLVTALLVGIFARSRLPLVARMS